MIALWFKPSNARGRKDYILIVPPFGDEGKNRYDTCSGANMERLGTDMNTDDDVES